MVFRIGYPRSSERNVCERVSEQLSFGARREITVIKRMINLIDKIIYLCPVLEPALWAYIDQCRRPFG